MTNNRNDHMSPDSDRKEGSMKQTGGNLKEGAGNVLGDEKMKRDGQSGQAEGKLQNTWGGVKDKAREVMGQGRR